MKFVAFYLACGVWTILVLVWAAKISGGRVDIKGSCSGRILTVLVLILLWPLMLIRTLS